MTSSRQLSDSVTFGNEHTSMEAALDALGHAENIQYVSPSTLLLNRSVSDKLGETISIKDFGAIGDGVADDTAAIQAAFDYMKKKLGGTIIVPKGDYKISSPIVCGDRLNGTNRIVIKGDDGVGFGPSYPKAGSRIFGTHAGILLSFISCHFLTIQGITFDGSGCSAIYQTGAPTTDYLANLTVVNCHFFGSLTECIYGNLIYANIHKNTFGYFGTVGAKHRHIVCLGTSTNTSNSNRITGNLFYYAKGNESVRFDSGTDLAIFDNNFEQNTALPIRLNGVPMASIARNWFELNSGTTSEIELNTGTFLIDSNPTMISHNHFVPHASITHLVQVNTSIVGWMFDWNTGNIPGVTVANDLSHLISRIGNSLPPLLFPNRLIQEGGTWNVTDASPDALNLPFTGTWERGGNHVDVEISITYPANTSNTNAKIGGLPYGCTVVSVGRVLSNVPGGVDIATDAGANTATLFMPGTLFPITNKQLSGKLLYITLRYPAA